MGIWITQQRLTGETIDPVRFAAPLYLVAQSRGFAVSQYLTRLIFPSVVTAVSKRIAPE